MTMKELLHEKFRYKNKDSPKKKKKEQSTSNGTNGTDDNENGDDDSGDLYYLSTQQPPEEDDDSSNDEDDKKLPAKQNQYDKFQVPCLQLLQRNLISDTLPWSGNLLLESCNLWMGQCTDRHRHGGGSCSGLHHDFHDNFYLLVKGRKEFRLYSPNVAYEMETYGTIERIYPNGVISYVGNETRSDGIPLKLLEGKDEEEDDEEDDDDEEEELVLGKGFDYVSSSEEEEEEEEVEGNGKHEDGSPASKRARIMIGGGDDDEEDGFDAVDDYDEMMLADQQKEDNYDEKDGDSGEPPKMQPPQQHDDDANEEERRPNHFSRIGNPTDPNTASKFPKFVERCPECIVVVLTAGQSLYLPAGWFHSVTSMGDEVNEDNNEGNSNDGIHMAINYWYYPPDNLDNFEHPYQHDDLAKMR